MNNRFKTNVKPKKKVQDNKPVITNRFDPNFDERKAQLAKMKSKLQDEDNYEFVEEMRHFDYAIELYEDQNTGKFAWNASYEGDQRSVSNFNIYADIHDIQLSDAGEGILDIERARREAMRFAEDNYKKITDDKMNDEKKVQDDLEEINYLRDRILEYERKGIGSEEEYEAWKDRLERLLDMEDNEEKHIYEFPELTDEDKEVLEDYNLTYLGHEGENCIVEGYWDDLDDYTQLYLGYEMNPEHLYEPGEYQGKLKMNDEDEEDESEVEYTRIVANVDIVMAEDEADIVRDILDELDIEGVDQYQNDDEAEFIVVIGTYYNEVKSDEAKEEVRRILGDSKLVEYIPLVKWSIKIVEVDTEGDEDEVESISFEDKFNDASDELVPHKKALDAKNNFVLYNSKDKTFINIYKTGHDKKTDKPRDGFDIVKTIKEATKGTEEDLKNRVKEASADIRKGFKVVAVDKIDSKLNDYNLPVNKQTINENIALANKLKKDIAEEIIELIEVYYGDIDYGEIVKVEEYIIANFLEDYTIEKLHKLNADLEAKRYLAGVVAEEIDKIDSKLQDASDEDASDEDDYDKVMVLKDTESDRYIRFIDIGYGTKAEVVQDIDEATVSDEGYLSNQLLFINNEVEGKFEEYTVGTLTSDEWDELFEEGEGFVEYSDIEDYLSNKLQDSDKASLSLEYHIGIEDHDGMNRSLMNYINSKAGTNLTEEDFITEGDSLYNLNTPIDMTKAEADRMVKGIKNYIGNYGDPIRVEVTGIKDFKAIDTDR